MQRIEWHGCELVLMPQHCALLPETRTLLLGDLHLGKAATFRAAGIPVPAGTTDADLARLDDAIECTNARELVILGDLLHARAGRTEELLARLERWRRYHATLEIILVRGNHDRHAGDPPDELDVRCVAGPHPLERPDGSTLLLCHEPPATPDTPVMAAHVHPVVVLRDRTDRLRLPCFVFERMLALLPSFGSFTGGSVVRPEPDTHVFAIADDGVMEVTAVLGHRPERRRA